MLMTYRTSPYPPSLPVAVMMKHPQNQPRIIKVCSQDPELPSLRMHPIPTILNRRPHISIQSGDFCHPENDAYFVLITMYHFLARLWEFLLNPKKSNHFPKAAINKIRFTSSRHFSHRNMRGWDLIPGPLSIRQCNFIFNSMRKNGEITV